MYDCYPSPQILLLSIVRRFATHEWLYNHANVRNIFKAVRENLQLEPSFIKTTNDFSIVTILRQKIRRSLLALQRMAKLDDFLQSV